jgi:hypothetical protein
MLLKKEENHLFSRDIGRERVGVVVQQPEMK